MLIAIHAVKLYALCSDAVKLFAQCFRMSEAICSLLCKE